MAKLTGKGIPTRKTKASIGDIYTDTTTGIRYECVFSYRDNNDDEFDCQWKELPGKVEKKIEKNPGGEKREKQIKQESKEIINEESVKPEPKGIINEKPLKPEQKHTDYTAYSKNKK